MHFFNLRKSAKSADRFCIGLFVVGVIVIALATSEGATTEAEKVATPTVGSVQVVAYLADYQFTTTIDKIDWSALTQVNYFSVAPNARTGKIPEKSSSGDDFSQLVTTVRLAHEHGVKVGIVIGGGDGIDASIPAVAASATLRDAFIESLGAFCQKYHVDGVDLDWEPQTPTRAQLSDYEALIHKLRIAMPGTILSAAVNAETLAIAPKESSRQYVLNPQAVRDLDAINVMAYDLEVADHCSLKKTTRDMQAWWSYVAGTGASKRKLLFGMPFYGRAGTSWANTVPESYGDIIDRSLQQAGHSPDAAANYLSVSFPADFGGKAVTWYFNGPATAAKKTEFAVTNGFGGVMFWNLGQDHFDAKGHHDQYSLLPAIKAAMAAHTALISGKVFSDTNGNGAHDPGESGLAGWTVYLDLNDNDREGAGENVATTNADGGFSFARLLPGNYVVRVVAKSGWKQNDEGPRRVPVMAGEMHTGVLFGESTKSGK